ncbi:MAG: UDP-N-acetyl-2-amino-2-deoxyglucuronate dehydrogenase, partial [Bacteroidota bacterium]
AVQADLRAGKLENEWVSHQHSTEIMALLDEIRRQIGLTYPNE